MALSNDEEAYLLKRDFNKLLRIYQPMIRKFVSYKYHCGFIKYTDIDDVVQDLNVHLLEIRSNIQKNYNGKASLRAYVSKACSNYCFKVLKKETYKSDFVEITEEQFKDLTTAAYDHAKKDFIDNECRRFGEILDTYPIHKNRIILQLKLKFDISITEEDLEVVFTEYSKKEIAHLKQQLVGLENPNEKALMQILSPHFKLKAESLTKWIRVYMDEIVELLNHTRNSEYMYTREGVEFLSEMYFISRIIIFMICFVTPLAYIINEKQIN